MGSHLTHSAPSTTHFKFPYNLGDDPEQMNYMMFTAMKVSGGVDTRTLKFAMAEGNPNSVILPIPTGIGTQYQNNWDEQSMAGPAAAISTKGAGVMAAIRDVTSQGTMTGMVGAAADAAVGFTKDAWAGMQGAASNIPGAANAANRAGAGIVNEMMGFAATAPGIGDLVAGAQFSLNMRALQQTMMSYGGPGFRSFQWQFSMKPLSAEESQMAHSIVNFFKVRSMAAQSDMQFTRVYNLPDVFRVQFYDALGESQYLDKIGHCACTDVNVTYGGEKYTTFSGSHAPIQIDLSLSFKELELLNRQAVANEKGTGDWPGGAYLKDAKIIPKAPSGAVLNPDTVGPQ